MSVAEYLSTSYSPDCDYVDRHIEEHNLGEWDHANLQSGILVFFQTKPTRFRIPDVCVVVGDPGEQILRKPPFICIEVLSPDDRMSRPRHDFAQST